MATRKNTPEASEFRAQLTAVWEALGRPTARQLNATLTASVHGELPKQTLSNLLNGVTVPRWDTVAKFLTACQEYQKRSKIPLPADRFDLNSWKLAHERAEAAGRGGPSVDPTPPPDRWLESADSANDPSTSSASGSDRVEAGSAAAHHPGPPDSDRSVPDAAPTGTSLPRAVGPGSAGRRSRPVTVVLIATSAAAAVGLAGVLWFVARRGDAGAENTSAEPASSGADTSIDYSWPDAAHVPPDVTDDGKPIVLAKADAGRCEGAAEGSKKVDDLAFTVDGREIAQLWTYFSASNHQACAKLVKPVGSPYAGVETHIALTLCGDLNRCDLDWHAYLIDAGPVVVPSRSGCMSWRVSMTDESKVKWLVRGETGSAGCPAG